MRYEKWKEVKFTLFLGERKWKFQVKEILIKISGFILKYIKFHKISLFGCRSIQVFY